MPAPGARLTPGRPIPERDRVELGYVSGVFGVRGEVRLFLHHRDPSWMGKPRGVSLLTPDGRWFSADLVARVGAGKRVLGRFTGVDGREDAAAMKGWKVVVHADALPAPAADEFYVRDVVGMRAVVGDQELGTVTFVHATGEVDLFEITPSSGEPHFVPALVEFVDAVDTHAGVLRLRPAAVDERE